MSLGFYFDMTRCSGCAACRTACQDRFDLFEVGFAPRRVHRYQTGTFPSVAGYVTSVSCNHCEKPGMCRKIVRRELCSRTRTALCCMTMMCASAVKRA